MGPQRPATVVYTIPELARVGMLEDDARQASIDLDVRHRDTSSWFSNYRVGESTAATKVLVDPLGGASRENRAKAS